MVVCICNPCYKGGQGRKVMVQGQPYIKVKPYLKNKSNKKRGKQEALVQIPVLPKTISDPLA
jgi:hypothetical protein